MLQAATRPLIAVLLIAGIGLGLLASGASALTLVTTVPVGPAPSWVSFDSNNNLLYATNYGGNTVSVINTAASNYPVTATIVVGNAPRGIALNLTTNLGYVVNVADLTLSVINLSTNQVVAKTSTASPTCTSTPWHIAVNPNTDVGYVTVPSCNLVDVFNLATTPPQLIGTLATGNNPLDVVVNSTTNQVYVTVAGATGLWVFSGWVPNAPNNVTSPAATISLGSQGASDRMAINTQTNEAYVSIQLGAGSEALAVVNTCSNQMTASIPLNGNPDGVAVDQTTNQIYVGDLSSPYWLWQIDGNTNMIVGNVQPGNQPIGVALNPTAGLVFTANSGDNTVSVVSMSSLAAKSASSATSGCSHVYLPNVPNVSAE